MSSTQMYQRKVLSEAFLPFVETLSHNSVTCAWELLICLCYLSYSHELDILQAFYLVGCHWNAVCLLLYNCTLIESRGSLHLRAQNKKNKILIGCHHCQSSQVQEERQELG